MRPVLFVSSLVATSALAQDLPFGSFEGRGVWRNGRGESGHYVATTEIFQVSRQPWSVQVVARRELAGREVVHMFVACANAAGGIDVYAPGAARIGAGHCREHFCHFVFDVYGMEESYRVEDHRLQTWGARKLETGESVSWREEFVW